MFRDLADGIGAYGRAFDYLRKKGVWLYALIPSLISLLLAVLFILGIRSFADDFGTWLLSWWPWEFGQSVIEDAAKWIGGLIMGVLSLLFFKYIVLILASPFMSPLSEKIEKMATGQDSSIAFSLQQMIQDLIRGLRINLRNILRELFYTIILLLLGLIPLLNIVSGILIFLVQAYYAGFGNMDFTLERYYRVRKSVRFVRRYKGLAVGNGAIFILMLGIPVVGVLLVLPLSTIAATLETCERIPDETKI